MSMKVKLIGKETTEKGWAIMDEQLGAVKIIFPKKYIVVYANGKTEEYQQKELDQ